MGDITKYERNGYTAEFLFRRGTWALAGIPSIRDMHKDDAAEKYRDFWIGVCEHQKVLNSYLGPTAALRAQGSKE